MGCLRLSEVIREGKMWKLLDICLLILVEALEEVALQQQGVLIIKG